MSEAKTLPAAILQHIARELHVSLQSLHATLRLLDEGGTIPFIARYRKEATGNLDEVAVTAIQEKTTFFRELEDRRATILSSIADQGKLTDQLKAKIESVLDRHELEDLYLPYKPRRRTKATIARERGLEPLAEYIANQVAAGKTLLQLAASLVNPEREVRSVEEALEGARHILAEQFSENAEYRAYLRQLMLREGIVVSRAVKASTGRDPAPPNESGTSADLGADRESVVLRSSSKSASDPEGKFKMYFEYSEPASKIPSHRMLAIRRGSNENILYFQIELDPLKPLAYLKSKIIRRPGDWVPQLELAAEDSWKRLLNLSIQTEVRLELKQRSDEEAIRVFRENLQNLLLSPPAGSLGVLGVDPGIRTGCKLAVVDETGRLLDHAVMYPLPPRNDVEGAKRILSGLIARHNVRAIAIGNGTGSREVSAIIQDFLREAKLSQASTGRDPAPSNESGTSANLGAGRESVVLRSSSRVFSVVVSESGASVYSASELARLEFPDLDLTVRGAISIARRLQDPLAELVKIDPKSIGVGQYQHDVDQRKLNDALEATVVSCVNRVGVDLNTASFALLRYVAGINERIAQKIVAFRNQNGPFKSRVELRSVSGFGPKTFEQAAGFLRIRGGENPLDITAVHPESYPAVERIAQSLKVTVADLIAKPALAASIQIEKFASDSAGVYTLKDIQEELRKPGRDPRAQFVAPHFQSAIKELSDLSPGLTLEGVITNVTAFGAFVDIGVHQDGLVHVSELSTRFIKDPNEVAKVGQIVQVKVLSADPKAKRIALSIKALQQSELPKVKPSRNVRKLKT